jgi:hypothetical protein
MPRMKQSGSKKTRLTPRKLPHDREASGSGSVGGRNLRECAPKKKMRNENQISVVTWGRAAMMMWRMKTMLILMFFGCSIMEKGQL